MLQKCIIYISTVKYTFLDRFCELYPLLIFPQPEENAKRYVAAIVSCKKGIKIGIDQYAVLFFDPCHLVVYQTSDPLQGIILVLTECSPDEHVHMCFL